MEQKSFADIFEDVTKQAVKIQKKDYLPTGPYPIIDQGQEWCAGYTDREDGLFQDVPAYIFGDHTRIIKYTDEPFYLGADGVKLLKLREGIQANPRFFYYALKSQRIPDTGYNRHFKWLKESLYHVPTLNEQTHIADTLDTLSTLITLCKTKIFLFDELVKSRFVELFGDPVTNPMGWERARLADKCEIVTGNTPSRKVKEYYGNDLEWIKSDNITEATTLTEATEYLSDEGAKVGRTVETGSILMTCIAGSLRSIGNVAIVDRKVAFNQQINAIVPKKQNTYFMYEQFRLSKDYICSGVNMALKGILSKGQLSEIEFVFPPLALQNEFAAFVEQVDKSKLVLRQLLEKQRILKAALMQEYFAAK